MFDVITGQKGAHFMVDKKAITQIIFSYNPKVSSILSGRVSNNIISCQATDGLMCLDSARGEIRNSATKMEGVKEWNTKSINQSIYAIGGIKNVITLFAHLSNSSLDEHHHYEVNLLSIQNINNTSNNNNNTANSNTNTPTTPHNNNPKEGILEMEHDPQPILTLLITLAQYNPTMFQQEMQRNAGFEIIGFLLERINPQYFTVETISKLDKLALFILRTYGPNQIFYALCRNVLFNFRIWIYTRVEVQLKVFNLIQKYISSHLT
ncbi:hypothetical protein HMI54_010861, partial [Coelomomyces lativittatus]